MYAKRGLPVFPLKARSKQPLTAHGFRSATRNLGCIETWWKRWPDANIGIPTGAASGLLVLDVDPRNGGTESLERSILEHGPLPDTAGQITGGGGRHIIFRHPGGPVPKTLAPGIDLKGDGGYIVVAPSVHPSGNHYEWDGIEGAKALLNPAEPPPWLLERIAVARNGGRAESRKADDDKWGEGQRNNRLASLAGTMRRRGMSQEAIEAALLVENTKRCDPPLPEQELRRIARSVARYRPAQEMGEIHSAAYKDGFPAERILRFKTAAEIAQQGDTPIEVLAWPGVVAGTMIQVVGKIKAAGKTTYQLAQCASLVHGLPFLGEPTEKTPVVYLTEQPPATFKIALKRAGLIGSEDFIFLCWGDTLGSFWQEVAHKATEECKRRGAKVLVVDTLAQFAGIEGDGENQAGRALEAMRPLQAAVADGLAVIVIWHERKRGGSISDSGRGSSAIGGAVDTILNLSRPQGNQKTTFRVLRGISRLSDVPEQLVIELDASGSYIKRGTSSAVAEQEAQAAILEALPETDEGALTLEELCKVTGVKRTTAQQVLEELEPQDFIRRIGAGKKGDPHRFYGPEIDSAGNKTPIAAENNFRG